LQRKFPINKIKFVDLVDVGSVVDFGDMKVTVEAPSADTFKGYDIALFSAGADVSLQIARDAAKDGCIVIDNSSAWRMDPEVPLVVPEVNPDDVKWHKGIIANPNCSTIQMLLPLKHIHDMAKIKRIVVSTYQAVSGTGLKAIEECLKQAAEVSRGESVSKVSVYPHQIALMLFLTLTFF
jgi:aspartate-semialdehyde dehydrogenase